MEQALARTATLLASAAPGVLASQARAIQALVPRLASNAQVAHISSSAPTCQPHATPSASSTAGRDCDPDGNRAAPPPVSQGVAIMLARERRSPAELAAALTPLAQQMMADMAGYSVTEVAAFCEVCRKCDVVVPGLADKVLTFMMVPAPGSSKPGLASLDAEEIPGVVWLLGRAGTALPHSLLTSVADALGHLLPDVRHEDFPDLVMAVSALAIQDAFLLTELAEAIEERVGEFSPDELVAIVAAYGGMRRQYYDAKLWDKLADEVVRRQSSFQRPQLAQVWGQYAQAAHRHPKLQAVAEAAAS